MHHLVSSLDRNRSGPEKKQMYPRRDLFSPCFARLDGISGDGHKIQQEKAVNLISMVTISYKK